MSEIVKVLRETCHNGFPVIHHTQSDTANPDGQLVGVILRHQIMLLLEQRVVFEADSATLQRPIRHNCPLHVPRAPKEQRFLERAMRVYHHYHHPHRRYLSSRAEAVSELEIDELLQVTFVQLYLKFRMARGVWTLMQSLSQTSQNGYRSTAW